MINFIKPLINLLQQFNDEKKFPDYKLQTTYNRLINNTNSQGKTHRRKTTLKKENYELFMDAVDNWLTWQQEFA